jgi:S-adenosylmethionine decarboxylase proenzyme
MVELGRHLIAELYGCDQEALKDLEGLTSLLWNAAEAMGATPLGKFTHQFPETQGVTVVVVIAESHISIHTWPEYRYAALDIFSCGERADPWLAYEHVKSRLKPLKADVTSTKRGRLEYIVGVQQV